MKNIIKVIFLIVCVATTSCKKWVELDSPVTTFDAGKIYEKDVNAIAVLTGIYKSMSGDDFAQGLNSVSFMAGLSSDELIDYPGFSAQRTAAYQNDLKADNFPGVPFWSRLYYFIYTANTAVQGLEKSTTLTPTIKTQLLGEAKFMRAFFYFYLVNFWGDVPLIINNDYNQNKLASRSAKADVYKQIVSDLKEAQSLLSSDYLLSDLKTVSDERIRPNKWAATALLARVYLYQSDYGNAEIEASKLLDNNSQFHLEEFNYIFLKTSKEAIWQIQSIDPAWNTLDAKGFILSDAPNFFQPVSISPQLYKAFQLGDQRKTHWIDSVEVGADKYYFANKYKVATENAPKTENLMVLRLSEIYLIRAEARANLENIAGAQSDLNLVRERASLVQTKSTDKTSMLRSIEDERQVELFTEWGHRWLDLKRTNRVNDVLKIVVPQKGGVWEDYKAFYPIPQSEIIADPNLHQNLGY